MFALTLVTLLHAESFHFFHNKCFVTTKKCTERKKKDGKGVRQKEMEKEKIENFNQ